MVRCDEASLRELFDTVLGSEAGYVILDTVRGGDAVSVKMADGSVVVMDTVKQALQILAKHFNWCPSGIEALTLQFSL